MATELDPEDIWLPITRNKKEQEIERSNIVKPASDFFYLSINQQVFRKL